MAIMRQLNYITVVIFLSVFFLFSSCSKNNSTPGVDQKPSLTFTTLNGYVSTDATLGISSPFKVGLWAASNTNSAAKLTRLTVRRVFNNNTISNDTTFSTSALHLDINATSNSGMGKEKWYFRITDDKNQYRELSLTITTIVTLGK